MGYAELIEQLKRLPLDRQAEVFHFVEDLTRANEVQPPASAAPRAMPSFLAAPFRAPGFQPLTRDEAHARGR